LVLGQYGALTPENARELAREKLAGVARQGRRPLSPAACGPSGHVGRWRVRLVSGGSRGWSDPRAQSPADQDVDTEDGPKSDRDSHQAAPRRSARQRSQPPRHRGDAGRHRRGEVGARPSDRPRR
jgi:hypothetical protein